jgi:nucleolar protein 12
MPIKDLFNGKSLSVKDNSKLSSFLPVKKPKTESLEKSLDNIPPKIKDTERSKIEKIEKKNKEEASRTIFLGNLPLECAIDKKSLETFKKWFLSKTSTNFESIRFRGLIVYKSGEILSRPDMLLLRKSTKLRKKSQEDIEKGSANAYIVLKSEPSDNNLEHIIAKLNGELYSGRHLRADRVDSAVPSYKKTIFLGNLPLDLQEEDLWKAFGKFPLKVTNVRLIRDKKTNVGKGIAYVGFSERGMVRLSIDLFKKDPLVIKNRTIRVSKCNSIK